MDFSKLFTNGWLVVGSIFLVPGIILLLLILGDEIKTPWLTISRKKIERLIGSETVALLCLFMLTVAACFLFFGFSIQSSSSYSKTDPTNPLVVPNVTPANSPTNIPTISPSIPSVTLSTVNTTNLLVTSKPDPIVLKMDGSGSAPKFTKAVIERFCRRKNKVPECIVYGRKNGNNPKLSPSSSNDALASLKLGQIDIAEYSDELTPSQKSLGLLDFPLINDVIAVVIGTKNTYDKGLTLEQLKGIYTCSITNWSQVGGDNIPIKVFDRFKNSGTRQYFQRVVLNNAEFCSFGNNEAKSNFEILNKDLDRDKDHTSFQRLGKDGIYYASFMNVQVESTVRPVLINGKTLNEKNYPLHRVINVIVPKITSPFVKEFLDYRDSGEFKETAAQFSAVNNNN